MTSTLTAPENGEQAPEQVKHTPGPWERRVDWTGSVIRIEGRESPDEQRRIIGYATTFSMAEIIGGKNHADGGKAYANARLIAAAPDMLAALEELLALAELSECSPIEPGDECHAEVLCGHSDCDAVGCVIEKINCARAAIAKATGAA